MASSILVGTRKGTFIVEELRRGLPQENAYDVVYRHALANCQRAL